MSSIAKTTPNRSDSDIEGSKSESCDLKDAKLCSSQMKNGSDEEEKDISAKSGEHHLEESTEEAVETGKGTTDNSINDDDDDVSTVAHPYVGKEVRIEFGPGAGTITTILSVATRGWWKLADIDGAIHSRRCMLLDDVPEQEMVEWYEKRGTKYYPSRARFRKSISQVEEDDDNQDNTTLEENSANENLKGAENSKRKRKFPIEDPFCMSDLLKSASSPPIQRVYCEYSNRKLKYADSKLSSIPAVTLHRNEDQAPSALKHLEPSQMLDVFDRKTGKIKSGNGSIAVQDLPHILRQHAEYEPIVPVSSSLEPYILELPRQGRSSKYTQVSAKVLPQKPLTHFGLNGINDAYVAKICDSTDTEKGRKTVEDGGHKTKINTEDTDEKTVNSVFRASLVLTMRTEINEVNKKIQELKELKTRLNRLAKTPDKKRSEKYRDDAKNAAVLEARERKQKKLKQFAHEGLQKVSS